MASIFKSAGMMTFTLALLLTLGLSHVTGDTSEAGAKSTDTNEQNKRDSTRDPRCYIDDSYILQMNTTSVPPQMYATRAVCNCSYIGKSQVGSNSGFYWFQNRTCGNTSFANMILNQQNRRAWEISCQCQTLADDGECLFSDLEGRWTKCMLTVAQDPEDPTYCTTIRYPDGTVVKGHAWCQLAGVYDWGRI